MLAAFSPLCRFYIWKPSAVLQACTKAFYDTVLQRTLPGSPVVPLRYFANTEMRLESQFELSSASQQQDKMKPQDVDERLFQVMLAVRRCVQYLFYF